MSIATVTNPAYYRLFADGTVNTFQSASCGIAEGDDLAYSIENITFDNNTNLATLTLNSGVLMPDDRYRIVVCSDVTDLASNQLDGNRNGISGDLHVSADLYIDNIPQIGSGYTANVTTDGNDGLCGVLHCTLREAVIAANTYGDGSVLYIPANTYTLT